MELTELAQDIHQVAVEHGWWDTPRNDLDCICLMHSELSEAVEELRKGSDPLYIQNDKPEGWVVELADTFIRMLDFTEAKGVTALFVEALKEKIEYNRDRPYRHGNKKY